MEHIPNIGQKNASSKLITDRRIFSNDRIESLKSKLETAGSATHFDSLAIFVAGSFGRLEGSQHSDIDLFFVSKKPRKEYQEINIPQIRLLSEVITIGDSLNFPQFSNDGQFLKILFLDEMLNGLGSAFDDMTNHFTARMLLLLESKSIFGLPTYEYALSQTVESYFRDYEHHPKDFRPTFIINDILRYWKTLCLNYEHRRNQVEQRQKIKQKVKNFKLKFSRLMTCFATVAALCTYKETITPEDVIKISSDTPVFRLLGLAEKFDQYRPTIAQLIDLYTWFLEQTAQTTEELESYFEAKQNSTIAFENADKFGKLFFDLVCAIGNENGNLRYLVL